MRVPHTGQIKNREYEQKSEGRTQKETAEISKQIMDIFPKNEVYLPGYCVTLKFRLFIGFDHKG